MKSIKGLALGAALAGVVFTGAANADAATIGKDVAGTKYEEATTKLAALSITKGYPDGTVRPDENVTRAQTAAFMIRALNYQLAMDQSTTIFNDVAYEHPLSGAVQLASGKGIIKGYLDGTFRAEESVTIAQASAILVRMLGYGPAVNEADFPNSHLSKAAELGILKNVQADVNAPAKRGDIMLMISNALTVDLMKQTEWGNDHKWEEKKDENLLTEFFDLTVVETRKDFKEEYGEQKNYEGDLPRVRDTARTKIGSLKANELEFEGIGGTYTINEMFNATDFLAQEVQVWVDEDDDHVVYIADSKDQKVVVDLADKWDNDEMTKIKLDNGDKYDVRKDAKVIYNLEKEVQFDKLSDTEKKDLASGTVMLKVVLDSNEDVIGLVATNISESDRGLVEEANASKKIIDFMDGSATASQLKLDGKDFFVVRDGAIATLDDLEKEDVLNYFKKKNEDKYYILATSAKVSGTIENVKTTDLEEVSKYDLFIDGKKYDVAAGATYSDNKNEDIDDVDTDDLDEMDGVDATLYLNAAGDIQHIVTGELDSTVGNVAVVTKSVKWLTQDEEWELTIVNEFGKEVKYRFEYDDIDVDGKERSDKYIFDNLTIKNDNKGKKDTDAAAFNNDYVFIEYSVNKDGDLKSVDILRTQSQLDSQKATNGWSDSEINKLESKYLLAEADTRGDVKLDKYDENVKIKGNSYKVTRNSVFFDVTKNWTNEYKDVDTVKWDNIKDKENDIVKAFVKVKSNDRDLEYMFVTDSDKNLTSKGEYGFITGFKKVGRDDAVTITRIDGEKLTIVMDDKSYETIGDNYLKGESTDLWTKGAFIRYELNSDDEIDGMQIIATAGTKKGFYTAPISDSNKDDYSTLSIDNVAVGVVDKSTTSSISLSKLDGKASTSGNVVVNSNTVYVDLVDDGEMEIVGGVNRGDFVIAIDSDDDGNAADFVIIIGEDYKDGSSDSTGGGTVATDGTVTYITDEGGFAVDVTIDGESYELIGAAKTFFTAFQNISNYDTIKVAFDTDSKDRINKVKAIELADKTYTGSELDNILVAGTAFNGLTIAGQGTDKDGNFKTTISGAITVNANNLTIQGLKATGAVTVANSVTDFTATNTNFDSLTLNGGGTDSVHLSNVTVEKDITVGSNNVKVVFSNSTVKGKVKAEGTGKLTVEGKVNVVGGFVGDVTVDEKANVVNDADATLSTLKVAGKEIADFDADTLTYDVTLPLGTTAVPTVTATATQKGAKVEITQATALPGSASIVVTPVKGDAKTYTINYSVVADKSAAAVGDATVQVGAALELEITGAKDVAGDALFGNYEVTIKAGDTVLYGPKNVGFVNGEAEIILAEHGLEAGSHTISVTVKTVKGVATATVTVTEGEETETPEEVAATSAVETAETSKTMVNIVTAKELVNALSNGTKKTELENRLDLIDNIIVMDEHQLDLALKEQATTIILGDDISITGDYYGIAEEGKTIDGANKTIIGSLRIVADNVTLKNVTVDMELSGGAAWASKHAVQVFEANNVILKNVTLKNANVGLYVNCSIVTVENITTDGNGFGGIGVGEGSGTITPTLTVKGDNTHNDPLDKPHIYTDGTNTAWVVAAGYTAIQAGDVWEAGTNVKVGQIWFRK